MQKTLPILTGLLLVVVGILGGFLVSNNTSDRLIRIENKMQELQQFKTSTQEWQKLMARNDTALKQWEINQASAVAFQTTATSELRLVRSELSRLSCAVCVAAGSTGCQKFCVAPAPDSSR